MRLTLNSPERTVIAATIRITASEYAAELILWPALAKLLPEYPDIKVEIVVDYGLTDIVAERYDAGVRLGEQVAKDMIAVRIGPDMRMAVVGAPSYFARRKPPQAPQDLTAHDCINLRLPTYGGLYAWEFEKDGRELKVRVEGQFVFNNVALRLNAALAGFGLAYLPEGQVQAPIAEGRLVRVLADWCPPFSGCHLLPEPQATYARLRPLGRCTSLPLLRRKGTMATGTLWKGLSHNRLPIARDPPGP
jgi:DNA-binding transcriptional LysR family regulator